MAKRAFRSVSLLKIPGAFEITEAQAETGVLFTRGKNLPTVTIDLVHGTVADISLGDLQADAQGGMTSTMNFGKFSIGVHWRILDPIGEETTWKLGCRDSKSAGTAGDYKREPYAQFLIGGRLGTAARSTLLATYVAGAALGAKIVSAKIVAGSSAVTAAVTAAAEALKAGATQVGPALLRWLLSRAPALGLG